MIYQKIETKPSCEELEAVYDRVLFKHSQRMKRYFIPQIVNYNRKSSAQIIKLEKQFANTIFNKYKEGVKLAVEDLQDLEPVLFIRLCSKVDTIQNNAKVQRKRSLNQKYSSIKKYKQAKRNLSQKKIIHHSQATLFEEYQLKEIQQKMNKILKQSANSDSFFTVNFMKIFQKKASIVNKISNARKQSRYDQGFKCFQRAYKTIEDIKTSKNYIISCQLVLQYKQTINVFLNYMTDLISFLGNRLKQLTGELQNTKVTKQQIFSMQFIHKGLHKARIKAISSILQLVCSCCQRVRQYYQNQLKYKITLKQLDYLILHFESEVEYIATFVNKELGSISKQFISFKTYNTNIINKFSSNRLQLDNKQSQKLLIKIQRNFSKSYEYILKLFEHIKEVSSLDNLLIPLPYLTNQNSIPVFTNKRTNKNKRIS